MTPPIDLTPEYPFVSSRDKIVDDPNNPQMGHCTTAMGADGSCGCSQN